jgi:hypothetical protein
MVNQFNSLARLKSFMSLHSKLGLDLALIIEEQRQIRCLAFKELVDRGHGAPIE